MAYVYIVSVKHAASDKVWNCEIKSNQRDEIFRQHLGNNINSSSGYIQSRLGDMLSHDFIRNQCVWNIAEVTKTPDQFDFMAGTK